MTMVNELMGWDFGMGFMNYGERWRTHRRLMHLSFHPAAVLKYRRQLLRSTRNLLNRFLDFPDDNVIENVRHMAGETIVSVAYGIEVLPKGDPYIAVAEKNMRVGAIAAVPGAFLVDNLPFLKYVPDWFPGADFKRKAKEWKELARLMIYPPFDVVKRNIAAGSAPPSFVANAFDEKLRAGYKDAAYQEDVIREVSLSLYAAGSDTTVNTIAVCILGLLDHPEVLKKAQVEID
ncbi:unnamed protein product [Cyclocybe aegerita]|uniref:O-methylsterigmatocystin oxidoreductase n=1 Tax=Cyclocybe aegerita TaxID=1973307 RepID=A0A8S0VTW2_CYCAE|nr:unnamed protein product [Cyclocybe aegerita]